jgi:hypothetical protein
VPPVKRTSRRPTPFGIRRSSAAAPVRGGATALPVVPHAGPCRVRALEEAIGACKAAIVLVGPRGFGNTQPYERDLAFVRQTRDPAFPVVPVILAQATLDRPFNFLQILKWIDFSHVARCPMRRTSLSIF